MRIKNLATGEIEEHEDGFAVRLIEQGRAVPVPAETAKKHREPAEAEAAEKPEAKAARKPRKE